MIKHVVLLNWKDGATQDQIDAVGKGFAELKQSISEIKKFEFGADAGIYKGNASYALTAEFISEDEFKTYVVHPKHQDFLNQVAGPILDSFTSAQFVME